MRKKIVAGSLVFLFFIAMVTAVIIKDSEDSKEVDGIMGNTIRTALGSDSGMSAKVNTNDSESEDQKCDPLPYGNNFIDTMTEGEFKKMCSEIIYNEISKESVGTYVYKDLFNWKIKENGNFLCSAIEDFVEEIKSYQKTYRNYGVIDCRIDNSFPIENNDVIRVYGIVEDVSQSYFTGGYNPTIKMYYMDYVRKYGKEPDGRTMEEIGEERRLQIEQVQREIDYKNSLNTDYDGTTKNIDGMDDLPLDEYISHCDKLNYSNLTNGENYTGRYVSIHVQLFKHKIFKSEKGKENKIEDWIIASLIQDDVWEIKLYSERAEDYIPDFGILYFQNIENINPNEMKNGQNIVIYGEIISQPKESYEDWELIVRYYEFE